MIDVLPVRTPTLAPATHTNVYRVGSVVIDPASPYPDEQARTLDWVLKSPTPVHTLLLTHHHADHIGGVVALRDSLRARGIPARVLAHADAVLPFDLDGTLDDGACIDTGDVEHPVLTALYTPGHADGHLVYVADGDVIAGDLVAGIGTILVAPPEGHLRTYLSSLTRLLPFAKRLHPAHGPCLSGEATLNLYLAHRGARNEQVQTAQRALGDGATAREIAEHVYAGIPGVNLDIAALQVAGSLVWLQEEHDAGR